jgi:hypothetical protein
MPLYKNPGFLPAAVRPEDNIRQRQPTEFLRVSAMVWFVGAFGVQDGTEIRVYADESAGSSVAQPRIVVASDVGGHREPIRDRDTGSLFPPSGLGCTVARYAEVYGRLMRG